MEEIIHRTTVTFNGIALRQLGSIKQQTRYSTRQVLENALAMYAAKIIRQTRKEKKAAKREGNL